MSPCAAFPLVGDGAVAVAPSLDPVAVDARGTVGSEVALQRLLASVVVHPLEVERVDVTWDVTETGEGDVYEQVSSAALVGLVSGL